MINRKVSGLDNIICEIEHAIECIFDKNLKNTKFEKSENLSPDDLKKSGAVMRVNHMGEVCAQALYRGQAAFTKDKEIKKQLYSMCEEEKRHLDLCNLRLNELKSNRTIFNPVWYIASFSLGAFAGLKEKDWKLGFIEETEKQVKEHLDKSIEELPKSDKRSKEFLEKIAIDEEQHRNTVEKIGAEEIPTTVKRGMHLFSNIMKTITRYI